MSNVVLDLPIIDQVVVFVVVFIPCLSSPLRPMPLVA